jgi:hypothetical protein
MEPWCDTTDEDTGSKADIGVLQLKLRLAALNVTERTHVDRP